MTTLLVSVRNRDEFLICRRLQVGIIDFKDPTHGALEPTCSQLWHESISFAGPRLSVALGEMSCRLDSDEALGRMVQDLPEQGISFAKIGWGGCRLETWQERWLTWSAAIARRAAPVMVAYADAQQGDSPQPERLLELAVAGNCRLLLLDTCDKRQGDLFAHLERARLRELLTRAHEAGLQVALAGSLRDEGIDRALELQPDIVAVRGAACGPDRAANIDPSRVARLLRQVEGRVDMPEIESTLLRP